MSDFIMCLLAASISSLITALCCFLVITAIRLGIKEDSEHSNNN